MTQAPQPQLPQAAVYRMPPPPDRPATPIQVYDPPRLGYSPADLTELGALLAAIGMTTAEAKALINDIQQVAAQTATSVAPKLLEGVRRIQQARIMQMMTQVRLLPATMGYVSRDRVIQIIQDVSSRVPQS